MVKWDVGTMELCNGASEAACAARGQCCGLVLWPGRLASSPVVVVMQRALNEITP